MNLWEGEEMGFGFLGKITELNAVAENKKRKDERVINGEAYIYFVSTTPAYCTCNRFYSMYFFNKFNNNLSTISVNTCFLVHTFYLITLTL